MRCWIVATYEPLPTVDAGSRRLRCGLLADQLVADGHEVHWFTSTFHHVQRRNRFDQTTMVEVAPGYRITMLHAPPYEKSISLRRVRHNRAMASAFKASARSLAAPDVILACVPSLELAEQAVAVGGAMGVPVVVDVRDPWPEVYVAVMPRGLRTLARVALTSEFRRARRIFRSASALTAVSSEYLRWARNLSHKPIGSHDGVFPIGFPVAAQEHPMDEADQVALDRRLRLSPNDLVVTFVGMFGASYDLETVVEAARLLDATSGHRIRIVVAGEGDKDSTLRRHASDLRSITFTGWLDRRATETLLRRSSVGLAAYAERARQSLPNKPFEYMAFGLPIVSSLKGELAEMIEVHNIGRLYRAHDARSLAAQLLWLWEHQSIREDMGRRARALLEERYRADDIYARFARHLCQLAGGDPRVPRGTAAREHPVVGHPAAEEVAR